MGLLPPNACSRYDTMHYHDNMVFECIKGNLTVQAKHGLKAMDDIGVVMTPFGDVVTVILVANSYVNFQATQINSTKQLGEMTRINFSGARHPWP